MKEKFIETVKKVIEKDYDCISRNICCFNCPASYKNNKTGLTCGKFFQTLKITKKNYFENWLKENTQEKTMTEKIQMTEEQAKYWLYNCVFLKASEKDFEQIIDIESSIREMKNIGVIRKSELETLVEDAEEMWEHYRINCLSPNHEMTEEDNLICKLHETLQAFKEKYPEFNK